jgi:hypothetical protein
MRETEQQPMRDGEPAHILIVPPVGLLEVVHTDHGIDQEGTLRVRAEGAFATLRYDEHYAYWLVDNAGTLNPRARWVWAELTGVHMSFTGPVIFQGIEERRVGDLVGHLSTRVSR